MSDRFVMDEHGTHWQRPATVTEWDAEAERDLERIAEIRAKVAGLVATGILAQPNAGGLTFVQAQEIGDRVARRVVPW